MGCCNGSPALAFAVSAAARRRGPWLDPELEATIGGGTRWFLWPGGGYSTDRSRCAMDHAAEVAAGLVAGGCRATVASAGELGAREERLATGKLI
jgi:hypothetical protein